MPTAEPITERQKFLVQSSFEKVAPISEIAARIFYDRLFELEPSVRPLFKRDLTEQGRMLMQMLSIAVHGLDHLDTIVPAVQQLGKRHVGYGVAREHYQIVGEALLWTLAQGLGDEFTPEVREAWATTYALLAETATDGAYN